MSRHPKLIETLAVALFTAIICALLWLAFVYGQHKTDPYRNHPTTTQGARP